MSLLEQAVHRVRGGGLPTLLATLAAFVTGAAVFFMPTAVLQEAVSASGLSSAISQLQPPLGAKARLGLAFLTAGSAFGTVLLLTRLVLRPAPPRASRRDEANEALPRVRRRDRHPDAPVRSPLSVTRDLGVSVDEEEPARAPALRRGGSVEPEPFVPEAPRPLRAERQPIIRFEPEALREEPPMPEAEPEPEVEEPFAEEPAPLEERAAAPEAPEHEWEPEPESKDAATDPEPLPASPQAEVHRPAWLALPPGQPAPAQESISDLVDRLERAIERRSPVGSAPAPSAAADEAEPMDLRLRSALENLKRFAPRRG
jgi:hypothetical protein